MTRRKSAPIQISFASRPLDWPAFRVYVFAYWSCAAVGQRRTHVAKMRQRLLQVVSQDPILGGNDSLESSVAYDVAAERLSLNAEGIRSVTGLRGRSAELYFSIHQDFAKLFDTFSKTRRVDENLDLGVIHIDDREELRRFGWLDDVMPGCGYVVVDSKTPQAWFCLSPSRTGQPINSAPVYDVADYIVISKTHGSWLPTSVDLEALATSTAFVRDVLILLRDHHKLPMTVSESESDITVVDARRRTDWASVITEGVHPCIWVVASHKQAVMRQCAALNAARRRSVVVVTLDVVEQLARLYPWLWSRHGDRGGNVEIIAPGDFSRLAAALLPSWTLQTYREFLMEADRAARKLASAVRELCLARPERWRLWELIEPDFTPRRWQILDDLHAWVRERVRVRAPELDVHIHAERAAHKTIAEPEAFERARKSFYDHLVARYRRALFPIDPESIPALELISIRLAGGPVLAVQGSSEGGRSTIMFGVARRLKTGFIVFGSQLEQQRTTLASTHDLDLVRSVIDDPLLRDQQWTFVVEHIELDAGLSPSASTLSQVIALADRINRRSQGNARVLFTALDDGSEDYGRTFGGIVARVVPADYRTERFLDDLFDLWSEVCSVVISDELRRTMIERIIKEKFPLVRLINRIRLTERVTLSQEVVDKIFGERYDAWFFGP